MKAIRRIISKTNKMCLTTLFVVVLYVGVFVLGVTTTWAYSASGIHWGWGHTGYVLDSRTLPSSWRTAIQNADATWDAAGSGSTFVFGYLGTYTSSTSTLYSYFNYVAAANSGSTGKLATTYTTYSGAYIQKVYEIFNTYYSFSIGGSSTTYDVQNIATHEFGHWLWLGDLYNSASSDYTMYGYSSKNETKKRSLATDDINGISYLY